MELVPLNFRLAELVCAAKMALQMSGVKEGDKITIWTDTRRSRAPQEAFFSAALALGANPLLLIGTSTSNAMNIPPHELSHDVFKKSDFVLDLASNSWVYTDPYASIMRSGVPVLQVLASDDVVVRMPPIPEITERAKKLVERIKNSAECRITSNLGTDLVVKRRKRPWVYQSGHVEPPKHLYDSVGVSGIVLYPEVGAVDGTVVVNGPVALYTCPSLIPESPIRITVEGSKITRIEGGRDSKMVEFWFNSFDDPNSYLFAHTGFGLDWRTGPAPLDPIEIESMEGGINVAFGSNITPHGEGDIAAKSHMDAILMEADLLVDEDVLVRDGRIQD